MRIAPAITITEEQALQLQAWARGRSVEVRLAQRAQMILLAAQGMTDQAIAAELKVGQAPRPSAQTHVKAEVLARYLRNAKRL